MFWDKIFTRKKQPVIDYKEELRKIEESFLWWCEVREVKFYGMGGININIVKMPVARVVEAKLRDGVAMKVIASHIAHGKNVRLLKPANPECNLSSDVVLEFHD